MSGSDVVIDHPNRDKASSRATKAIVLLLMLTTAGLVAIVTLGGWATLEGAKMPQIAYILVYLILAFYIARWRSGMLPVAAALAIILLIFAAIAGPEWFARDKQGFSNPPIDESLLGILTILIVPVQVALIAFAMRGFSQQWHVEVERRVDRPGDPAPAG